MPAAPDQVPRHTRRGDDAAGPPSPLHRLCTRGARSSRGAAVRGTNPSEKHQNTRGGGARCARGEMHALAHKLPAELVDLILQHAAAMTLQGGA
eukprot:900290-Prymnesium_polylepis.1